MAGQVVHALVTLPLDIAAAYYLENGPLYRAYIGLYGFYIGFIGFI